MKKYVIAEELAGGRLGRIVGLRYWKDEAEQDAAARSSGSSRKFVAMSFLAYGSKHIRQEHKDGAHTLEADYRCPLCKSRRR